MEQRLADEVATVAFGTKIAEQIINLQQVEGDSSVTIYLHGDLGAGKTTLTRGVVTGLGHQGKVKSPTYTLVEPYELDDFNVYHFDLYRLADPEELEFMGIRDYFNTNAICLVEWPQKGQGFLPAADLSVNLVYVEQSGQHCRSIKLSGLTPKGDNLVKQLEQA